MTFRSVARAKFAQVAERRAAVEATGLVLDSNGVPKLPTAPTACGNIFHGKGKQPTPGGPKTRVQGVLSREGAIAFQYAKDRLRRLYRDVKGRQPSRISDGDCIEFLARGVENTRAYLEQS